MRETGEPILDGLKTGAAIGLGFSIFVPLFWFVAFTEGSWEFLHRGTPIHVGVLSLTYPLGAIASFSAFTLVADRIRRRAVAVMWGAVSGIPWGVGIMLGIDRGYTDWTLTHTFVAAAVGLVFAAFGWGYTTPDEQIGEATGPNGT